jgi:hypothetical protein
LKPYLRYKTNPEPRITVAKIALRVTELPKPISDPLDILNSQKSNFMNQALIFEQSR